MGVSRKILSKSHGKRYKDLVSGISCVLGQARRASAKSVNAILTATYWDIGRRIVEFEQKGQASAEYGEKIVIALAKDLTVRFGRGFSKSNLFQMRSFYLVYKRKFQTVSGILKILILKVSLKYYLCLGLSM